MVQIVRAAAAAAAAALECRRTVFLFSSPRKEGISALRQKLLICSEVSHSIQMDHDRLVGMGRRLKKRGNKFAPGCLFRKMNNATGLLGWSIRDRLLLKSPP